MKLPVTTLQADERGRLNGSPEGVECAEYMCKSLKGTDTTAGESGTEDALQVDSLIPLVARDRLGATAKKYDPVRRGPLVVPFQRHLLGQGLHGFSADNSLLVALGRPVAEGVTPDEYPVGLIAGIDGYDTVTGLPYIKNAKDSSTNIYGVVKGCIENAAKRTRRGTVAFTEANLYSVQMFGVALAAVKNASSITAGTPLYISFEDNASVLTRVASSSGVIAYFLGGLIPLVGGAGTPASLYPASTTVNYVYMPSGGGSGAVDSGSFAYQKCELEYLVVNDGMVRWSGRGKKKLCADDVTNRVKIEGGYVDAPGYVSIQINVGVGISSARLVYNNTEPEDDGTFVYRVLHEAYLDESGKAAWKRDRRADWNIGSVI